MVTTIPQQFIPTKAVFYFRTLSRWPGGNSDMLTLKASLRLSESELEAQFYSCFDGRHAWYPARRIALASGDALTPFLEVTRSLASRGEKRLVYWPLDTSEDEWDCEWAEVDVYLYTTDDAPETPEGAALWLARQPSKSDLSNPDPEIERAFALAQQLTGVGRVFEFANTRDAFSAAYRAQGGTEMQAFDYLSELTPTFLPPETDARFLASQAAKAARTAARA